VTSGSKPGVLFVCVHNAGRSQMAAGYLSHLAAGLVVVRSAGSVPAAQINPVAVEAMAEAGIDITAEAPKVLTTEAAGLGCGDHDWGAGMPTPSSRANAMRTGSSRTPPTRAWRRCGRSAVRSRSAFRC